MPCIICGEPTTTGTCDDCAAEIERTRYEREAIHLNGQLSMLAGIVRAANEEDIAQALEQLRLEIEGK